MDSLSDVTLEKLSLIVWHFDTRTYFDASSYEPNWALDYFLAKPTDDEVWEAVYARYDNSASPESLPIFKAHNDYLCPQLGPISNRH